MSRQFDTTTSSVHHTPQLDEEQQIQSPSSYFSTTDYDDSDPDDSESDSGDHYENENDRQGEDTAPEIQNNSHPFLSRMRTKSFIDYTRYSKRSIGQFCRDTIAAIDTKFGKYFRFFFPNFICIHYFYIIFCGLIFSFFLYISGNIKYIDCFFLSYASVSQAGLNTVNLNDIHLFQQLLLYFVCIITTPIFIHTAVIFVRLYWFERTFDSIKSKSKLNFKMRRNLTLSARSMTNQNNETSQHKNESFVSKVAKKFSPSKSWKIRKTETKKHRPNSNIFIELRNMLPASSNALHAATTVNTNSNKTRNKRYSFSFKNGVQRTLTKNANDNSNPSKKFEPTDMYRSIAMMREKKEHQPVNQNIDSTKSSTIGTPAKNTNDLDYNNRNILYPISSVNSNGNVKPSNSRFDYEENEGPALVIHGPAERMEALKEEQKKKKLKKLQQRRKQMRNKMQKKMRKMSKGAGKIAADQDEKALMSEYNSDNNSRIGNGSFGSFLLQKKKAPLFSSNKKHDNNGEEDDDDNDFAIDDDDEDEEEDNTDNDNMEDNDNTDDSKVQKISPSRDDSDDEESIDPNLIVRHRIESHVPEKKLLQTSFNVSNGDQSSNKSSNDGSTSMSTENTTTPAIADHGIDSNIQQGRGGLSFNISERPDRRRQSSYSSFNNQSHNKGKLLKDIKRRPSFYLQTVSRKLKKYPSMMFEDLNNTNSPKHHHHSNKNSKHLGLRRSMSTGYLSFTPTFGRNSTFVPLNNQQKEELGGVEYRSLKLLARIIVIFYFGCQLLSFIGLAILINTKPYYKNIVIDYGINSTWWAGFTGSSAFNNSGLSLTPNSLSSFITNDFTLLWCSFFTTIGNVAFPIALRVIIWFLFTFLAKDLSLFKESLGFLLDHPRRCFTMLFPTIPTLWLFAVLVVLNVFDLVLFCILDIHNSDFDSIGVGNRVLGGFFQSISTRTSGFTCMSLADLHPAVQISYMVMMYVSVFPIAISIRRTNVYEEQSLGIYNQPESEESAMTDELRDDTDNSSTSSNNSDNHSKNKQLQKNSRSRRFIETHLRKQLSFDLWYIFFGVFIIAIAEGSKIRDKEKPDFNLFSIIFEVISAYCCVGLSLGYPNYDTSFAGQFNVISKLVLVAMFIRGRHRGLPYVIDRAIMLPSKTMELRDELQANRFRRSQRHHHHSSSNNNNHIDTDIANEDANSNNNYEDEDYASPGGNSTARSNQHMSFNSDSPTRANSTHRRIDEVMDPENENTVERHPQIAINSPNLDELNQRNLDELMNEDLLDHNEPANENEQEDNSSDKNAENTESQGAITASRAKPARRNTITFDTDTSFRTNANNYQQFS